MAEIREIEVKGTEYTFRDNATRNMVAGEYVNTAAYAVGDYVTRNRQLYCCKEAVAAGEAWSSAKWSPVMIGTELTKVVTESAENAAEVSDLKSATTALETYVRDMSPVAYGNDEGIPVPIVTIKDAAPLNAENVLFEIEPLQDGSGDPSPDNVRPISGWTGAKVTVSPTTDEADGTTYDITFPTEAGTVYGGTVDLTKGKLVVDRAMVTFDGTSSTDWAYITAYGTVSRFSYNNTNILPGINNAIANYLNNGPIGTANLECINTHGSYKQFNIQILTSRLSANTVAGLMAYFGDHPLQVCYELAAPITYDLNPQEIAMFKGWNNLWADTGDISVQYRQDVYTALNNKINELQALVLES